MSLVAEHQRDAHRWHGPRETAWTMLGEQSPRLRSGVMGGGTSQRMWGRKLGERPAGSHHCGDLPQRWKFRNNKRACLAIQTLGQDFIHSFIHSVSIWGAALELQHFGHLMQKADSLENTPMLGKSEGKKKGAAENEMGSVTDSTHMNRSKLRETVEERGAW